MDIGAAIALVKQGEFVTRKGWNGKRQHLYLIAGDYILDPDVDHGAFVAIHPTVGPDMPWLCSASDLLATDWVHVEQVEGPP